MANMFRCTLASGGGALVLTVTCDAEFAGYSVTATDGTSTLTQTCPSSSPYEIEFKLPNVGQWTISSVISGKTYSTQITVSDYTAELEYGFKWKKWVTFGGLDPDDYADLDDVFADEVAVRRLMTIHASADYLIEKVTDDVDEIDDFTANNTAMKWIGLRDYVCDGLTAIAGVEAKFLASAYWERYLKDHVPVMTSNTAPYGVASASSVFDSNNAAYQAFNPNIIYGWHASSGSTTGYLTYKFVTPTCVKRVHIKNSPYRVASSITVQGSNDGSTFENIQTLTVTDTSAGASADYDISNSEYYLYYRLNITASISVSDVNAVGFVDIQFYGRSLDVSVPVMTSNTAPYGTVNVSSQATNYEGFRAFDDTSSFWQGQNPTNQWVSYGFINAPVIKKFSLKANNSGSVVRVKNFKLQASNVADFSDAVNLGVYVQSQNNNVQVFECDNNTPYKYYRIFVLDTYGSSNYVSIDRLQFYGVDYSEREFAEGSTMKYLYDHGLLLNDYTWDDTATYASGGYTRRGTITDYDYGFRMLDNNSGTTYTYLSRAINEQIDFSNYNLLRYRESIGSLLNSGINVSSVNTSNYIGLFVVHNGSTSNISGRIYVSTQKTLMSDSIVAYVMSGNTSNPINDITELWLE